jgi:mono/diheme cytochrome c family protein
VVEREVQMTKTVALMIVTSFLCLSSDVAFAELDGGELFQKKKCGICHKIDKKGMGPSVITMNTDSVVLKSAIIDGRKAMPNFDKKLDAEQIDALLTFIQSRQAKLNPCAKNQSGK